MSKLHCQLCICTIETGETVYIGPVDFLIHDGGLTHLVAQFCLFFWTMSGRSLCFIGKLGGQGLGILPKSGSLLQSILRGCRQNELNLPIFLPGQRRSHASNRTPPAIATEQYPAQVKLAHALLFSSQAELADAFQAETAITAHPDTFAKALKLEGITRIKQRTKGSFVSPEPRKSYGYKETHRRQLPEQRYPSCLSDAEWSLVAVD